MAIAKFNGKSCPMCGAEFVAGQSEIEPHPTERGPRGGKVWVCAEHVHGGGAHENPYMNAGRRLRGKLGGPSTANLYKKGKQKGQPRLAPLPKASSCDYSAMSKEQLVADGKAEAIAELRRRGRDATGRKLAWGEPKPKKAKSNPLGYGFSF